MAGHGVFLSFLIPEAGSIPAPSIGPDMLAGPSPPRRSRAGVRICGSGRYSAGDTRSPDRF